MDDADGLADALGRWADGLAPAARDQLSTYDLRALYDHLVRRPADCDGRGAFDRWHAELGPATQASLSRYDRQALVEALRTPKAPPVPDAGLGTCTHCGGTDLVRTGSCLTCQRCGTSTGCG